MIIDIPTFPQRLHRETVKIIHYRSGYSIKNFLQVNNGIVSQKLA